MPTTFTFDSLMKAAIECAKGVRWKTSVAAWTHPRNLAANCLKLLAELEAGTYRLSPYSVFKITYPQERTIRAPKFRDRVVQRAACDLGLYEDLTRGNIYDNGACQKGKGTTFTMDRLSCHLRRYWRKNGCTGWYLRLDIRKFFDSIPHDKLKAMVSRLVRNPEFVWLACEVIDSFDGDGIGLGSQLSQLLAIAYLSDIDHYVKEVLRLKHYIRYSDDIVIIHHDKTTLIYAWREIERRLGEHGLSLNPKSNIGRIEHGISFMKFRYHLVRNGKVVRILARSNITHARRRLKRLVRLCLLGKRRPSDAYASFMSWKSHAELGKSYNTIRRINQCLNPIKTFMKAV